MADQGIMAGMDLTEQILNSPELNADWVQGKQRIMDDVHRDAAARADAGCALLHYATHGEHDGARGSIPSSLPPGLHYTWDVAFSDRDGEDRLPAVFALYRHISGTIQARQGEQILRREFGA